MITKIQSEFENPSFKTIKGNRTLPNHYVFKYTHDDVFNKIEIIESIKTCGFSTTYIGEISYSINNKKKKVVIKEFFPVLNHLCQRTDFSEVNPIANFEYFRKIHNSSSLKAPHMIKKLRVRVILYLTQKVR